MQFLKLTKPFTKTLVWNDSETRKFNKKKATLHKIPLPLMFGLFSFFFLHRQLLPTDSNTLTYIFVSLWYVGVISLESFLQFVNLFAATGLYLVVGLIKGLRVGKWQLWLLPTTTIGKLLALFTCHCCSFYKLVIYKATVTWVKYSSSAIAATTAVEYYDEVVVSWCCHIRCRQQHR